MIEALVAGKMIAQAVQKDSTKGDHVTLSGKASPKLWKDKQGISHTNLEMVAHKVMTVYDARPAKVLT